MDNDDVQLGRILSRREVLKLVGAAGAALLVGCGPSDFGTTTAGQTAASGATAAPTLNAEAATAVALEANPSAVATLEAEAATADAANTEIAAANATAVPACVVRPEVTEGPYYVRPRTADARNGSRDHRPALVRARTPVLPRAAAALATAKTARAPFQAPPGADRSLGAR